MSGEPAAPQSAAPPLSPEQTERALRRNIVAGTLGTLFATTIAPQFLTGYALALGATPFQVGLITSLPMIGFAFQIAGAFLTERLRNRRDVFFWPCSVHRLMWLLIAAVPYLLARATPPTKVWTFLIVFFLSTSLGSISAAPWLSWMADLVPADRAGRFWGRRAAILNLVGLTSIAFGRFVDWHQFAKGDPLPFVILFAFGAVVGEWDLIIHYKIPEPPMKASERHLTLQELVIQPLRNANFRRFVTFICAWNFAILFSNAYLNLYLIQELGRSYFFISILTCAMIVSRIAMAHFWGTLSDRYGAAPVLKICDIALLAAPLGMAFTTPGNCRWLLPALFVYFGIFNIGIENATTQLLLGLSPAENKSMFVAVFSSAVGIVAAAAPICGSWMMKGTQNIQVEVLGMTIGPYQWLFLAGFVMRVLTVPLGHRVHEPASKPTGFVVRRLLDPYPFRIIRHIYILGTGAKPKTSTEDDELEKS